MITLDEWKAGVVTGQRTVSIRRVEGFNCYDVMVDGDCAKRIYQGGEAEAIRRANLARLLYDDERVYEAECEACGRTIKTDRHNRLWPHNRQSTESGRVAESCTGSRAPVATGRP